MLGYDVNKNVLDIKSAAASLELRAAFAQVETIAKWLANTPSDENGDPLVNDFGYTADEAYLLRLVFGDFENIRTSNAALFDNARKLTGLE